MLKMESLIQRRGWERPEVWVWSENRKTERSEGYVRRLPFVKWGGYFRAEQHVAVGQQVFVHGKPWLMENWNGFDVFVAFNAPLGWGTHITKICPGWDINWNYDLRVTEDDLAYANEFKSRWGPYVLTSFFGHSFYSGWLKHFTTNDIRKLLTAIAARYTVVLTGREWDEPFMQALGVGGCVNLTGKTSMGQLLGLTKEARAFVGFAAGNGMLAQHLGCPTFMLWSPDQWHPDFATNWVDPSRRGTTYHPLSIKAPCVGYILERLDDEARLYRDRSGAQREQADGRDPCLGGSVGKTERPTASPGTDARGDSR
jgi:hypothetical protein